MADQLVLDELKKLERNGLLSPQDVLTEAANEASPLHAHFTWDDTEAAQRYRMIEARSLIRSFKLQVVIRDIPLDVVRFVRDPADGGSYRDISEVVQTPDEEQVARRIVTEEMRRVSSAARRARAVAAVLGTAADVEEILRIANTVIRQAEVTDQAAGAA